MKIISVTGRNSHCFTITLGMFEDKTVSSISKATTNTEKFLNLILKDCIQLLKAESYTFMVLCDKQNITNYNNRIGKADDIY
jgi:hypothetical protein